MNKRGISEVELEGEPGIEATHAPKGPEKSQWQQVKKKKKSQVQRVAAHSFGNKPNEPVAIFFSHLIHLSLIHLALKPTSEELRGTSATAIPV